MDTWMTVLAVLAAGVVVTVWFVYVSIISFSGLVVAAVDKATVSNIEGESA